MNSAPGAGVRSALPPHPAAQGDDVHGAARQRPARGHHSGPAGGLLRAVGERHYPVAGSAEDGALSLRSIRLVRPDLRDLDLDDFRADPMHAEAMAAALLARAGAAGRRMGTRLALGVLEGRLPARLAEAAVSAGIEIVDAAIAGPEHNLLPHDRLPNRAGRRPPRRGSRTWAASP